MNERAIFVAALEMADPAARAAYVDRVCRGQPELRARVGALLAAHFNPASFLDRPACGDLSTDEVAVLAPASLSSVETVLEPGARIGRYTLREVIGTGERGTVYLAEESAPIRREVAVKLLNPLPDSRPILMRLALERPALAALEHPNIARVLDAGTTDAGRLYFVTELVRGVPISRYCDEGRLTVPERLAAFRCVCEAVHHAHQKGIIHRDLKPSNILVGKINGRPTPKVTDFGLASATGGSAAGGPLYLAPEQAATSAHVDTRADIYALGVILYELLTGTTSLDRERARHAPPEELLRWIREEEPPAPSARLRTLPALSAVADRRRTAPSRLCRLIRGDLDCIALKALARDRNQRYDSASAFAADVGRYLNHEPVAARTTSPLGRPGKFLRRNRFLAGACASLVLALITALAGTTWGLIRSDAERKRALEANELTAAERARSDEAVDALAGAALEDLLSRRDRWGKGDRALLQSVREQLERLARLEASDLPPQYRLPSEYRRAAARVRLGLIHDSLGEFAEAQAEFTAATEDYTRLGLADPDGPARAHLARVYRRAGDLHLNRGRAARAIELYQQAEQILVALLAVGGGGESLAFERALTLNSLGVAHFRAGHFSEAEEALRKSSEIHQELTRGQPGNPRYCSERVRPMQNLVPILLRSGRTREAQQTLSEVVSLLKGLVDGHREPEYRFQLATALQDLFVHSVTAPKPDSTRCEAALRESLALHAALAKELPGVLAYRAELARCQGHLAGFLQMLARDGDCIAASRDALDTYRQLAELCPHVGEYRERLGQIALALSELLMEKARFDEAKQLQAQVLPVWEQLAKDNPGSPPHVVGLIRALTQSGCISALMKDPTCARPHLLRAEQLCAANSALLARDPNGVSVRALLYRTLARVELDSGNDSSAVRYAERLAALKDENAAANAYMGACCLAKAADLARTNAALDPAEQKRLAEDYARRAVHHLELAAERGYAGKPAYLDNPELQFLRDRSDFQELLIGLKNKGGKK